MASLNKRLSELAAVVSGRMVGGADPLITGVSGIKEARRGDITFLANRKYLNLLKETAACAVIVSPDIRIPDGMCAIVCDNPSLAFARIVDLVAPSLVQIQPGVHPTVVIGKNVSIGQGVSVHAYCVIEDGSQIADGTVVFPFVYIGHNSKIGKDSLIYSHVSIRERVEIGSRVIIHSGTVIGSDGFGFATVQGMHTKIPQIGNVIIEDDVEIGANTTVDRARFGSTVIKAGTKIDNLVQIAHNVSIGEHSIIVAQAGISGSAQIGRNVTIAGQAGVVGHITLGDNVIVAGKSGVTKDIPSDTMVSGFPAKPHLKAQKIQGYVQRLPKILEKIKELEQRLQQLEEKG